MLLRGYALAGAATDEITGNCEKSSTVIRVCDAVPEAKQFGHIRGVRLGRWLPKEMLDRHLKGGSNTLQLCVGLRRTGRRWSVVRHAHDLHRLRNWRGIIHVPIEEHGPACNWGMHHFNRIPHPCNRRLCGSLGHVIAARQNEGRGDCVRGGWV